MPAVAWLRRASGDTAGVGGGGGGGRAVVAVRAEAFGGRLVFLVKMVVLESKSHVQRTERKSMTEK